MIATSQDRSTGGGSSYLGAVMRAPMLARDDERALLRHWREAGDERALHRLIESHARLVVSIAMRYRRTGLPFDDLVQEGNLGLIEAASRFDLAFDNRFSTYASWWIDSAIQTFVMRNLSIVRLPTASTYRRLWAHARRMRASLLLGPGDALPEEERARLALDLGASPAEVARVDQFLAGAITSLDRPVGDEAGGRSMTLVDLIADDGPGPEEIVVEGAATRERHRLLGGAMQALNERERVIIFHRFLAEARATLAELGQRFGVSKERVRQLEGQALRKLRQALAGRLETAGG
jgi:RNA polymerase sigma-32 factor